MCYNARQHERFLETIPNLKNLKGSTHYKRRILKKAHAKQNGICMWCKKPTYLWWEITTEKFKEIGKGRIATIEHLLPASKGGTIKNNAACACQECNVLRGNIDIGAFAYVTQTAERFEKFKKLKAELSKRKARHRKMNKEKRQAASIAKLAVMFYFINRYHHEQIIDTRYFSE